MVQSKQDTDTLNPSIQIRLTESRITIVPKDEDVRALQGRDWVRKAWDREWWKLIGGQGQLFPRHSSNGREHHSSHEEEHGEHGKKAYEITLTEDIQKGGCTARVRWLAERKFLTSATLGKHEDTKTKKGYHDRENHIGKYDDQGGIDKDHHDESQHYGHHHHEEHGKKHAKYEESGKHSKGHSTKGSHDIHKKEEYEKNVEFFEEEGDDDEEETHGGHHDEKSHAEGGLFKKENLESGHEGHTKGDTGHYSKGGFGHYNKGHKSSGGHDGHGRHGRENHHTEGKDAGKKWIYHHGAPARTAHLKPIDRADPRLFRPRFF
ncbi:hypothetical protein RR46_09496 [Papilio xuthus]|uniref:Uncharacterized protein n=1 Tax=Papilio xuthus TaxID=66420 RepID=A0A194Q4E5_PAPXU|nr:hypothetical protein RR46_09496 [Papilio xuthus]